MAIPLSQLAPVVSHAAYYALHALYSIYMSNDWWILMAH